MSTPQITEKPEPGTWHIARPDSDRLPAFVTRAGRLLVFEDGCIREDHDSDGKWPNLTPARVVTVRDWAKLNEDLAHARQSLKHWFGEAKESQAPTESP